MSVDRSPGVLATLYAEGRVARNAVVGLLAGFAIAAAAYVRFVVAPEETYAEPALYVVLAVVLGLSIALLLTLVLSAFTVYRRAASMHGR